jgi:hypothetical protein
MIVVGVKDGHETVLEDAWERVSSLEVNTLASNSGAMRKEGTKTLALKVLDEECIIDLEKREISYSGRRTGSMSRHIQILILHYLIGAGNAQLANRPATFRDFDGGAVYYTAFKARTIDPLVKVFGSNPELLKHVCEAMRAERVDTGSIGFRMEFFPKLPVTVVLWLGDEEVPTTANMLFDANAGKILPTEDLSVLGGALVGRLKQLAK